MANVIKLRKGLDMNLKGQAEEKKIQLKSNGKYALVPDDFEGVTPKVVVREGDKVKAGDALFVNKQYPEVKFASPVSGTVSAVVRGERRKVLCVKVDADAQQSYVDFGKKEVSKLDGKAVVDALLEAGIFGYINQLPYAVSTNPSVMPKAIFVSALRDKPLAADFEFEVKGQEEDFQTGLTALSKIARTYLGVGVGSSLEGMEHVEVNVFDGPCPAGNVGVQVNHIDPVNKGEVVWTIGDPTVVLFIGRLFNKGQVDLTRTVSLCGSEVKNPAYVDMLVGEELSTLLSNSYEADRSVRIINGNVLTGIPTTKEGFLGAHTSEITVIPEGNDADEMLGWILPRFKQFSVNRSYFSWLLGKKKAYAPDARVKGGERHMIMSGEYDKVLPMDIYGEYLIKAIIAGDIDRQEALGIYEVAPEDFALAEFVDSSKLELQRIVREGLNILRKENA
ncbi:Na+-transporting NADH:ubiquinone oxidoreductase subunit A [Xylanibacter ruminicola]|uniref:Na(+)-translocating NADH-quinone reductase subunit A n=1 Tax=Xylanibacter ruminicola TaxID=839 RepID=A0A1H5U3F8_XYLRU|nr:MULTISPECIES: Na(+)-translocating NADH-quinone reductase subunit A [Prevotellaceae]SEF69550.1 Na+-transporting NADH:ubiquinone oxidoreductase subunit A [Xylanibacter ruminicola]SEV84002.1 Na+-transporting NADH:ubiquinone oxidoreductase subunit A [Prevotella sp. khp7]